MSMPTGTVTFLFTDIQGSTRLAQEHPDSWESLRKRHNDILQAAIVAQDGYVFQIIGDAFCAAFHTAGDALRAAIRAQADLYIENWSETPVRSRMGIHTGKAEFQTDGQYIGYATLSRVQRIMSAGHGGQTLLSQAAQELLRDDLPQDVSLRDMGLRKLKDMIQSEHIYQLEIPGLPTVFPALKTLDVQLNNLPAQLTAFVGREREIAAVTGLLRKKNVRLVTLTGPGGTGKTRLSLQVAAELLDEYEHGTWFVELAAITDARLVLPTIAATLKVKESAGVSIEQGLHDFLANRHLLLVIDNFEQVVSAASVIGTLLGAAPKVSVLVSSREVLRLRGEHDYPVQPLGLPETRRKQTAAVTAQYEAIALFIQHARAANQAFELDDENASIVAEICARLDGLPLAIVLAAARSRLLKPAAMLEKLKSRLGMLTGGARDLPRRQQTIRGAIDWSYELLDEAEKILFARLAIFSGGWTIESAEAVCADGLAIDVLSGLESLLDKSLLRPMDGLSDETRFGMLETIREYAFEKLAQSGELPVLQQAHAKQIEALLDKVSSAINGPDEAVWFAKLDDELENLRNAVAWALGRVQPALVFKAGNLYDYWFRQRSNYHEPLGWLERALEIEVSAANEVLLSGRAWALNTTGILKFQTGEMQQAQGCFEASLASFRELDDRAGMSECLKNMGLMQFSHENLDQARQFYEQSLAIVDVETFYTSITLNHLGSLERLRGNWQASSDYYLRARQICERLGAEAGVSYANIFLGRLALDQRDLQQALAYFDSALKAGWVQQNPLYKGLGYGISGYVYLLLDDRVKAQRLLQQSLEAAAESLMISSDLLDCWFIFEGKARLELSDGQVERAAQLFGIAQTQREKDDAATFVLTEAERSDYQALLAATRAASGDDVFEQAFARGQVMTIGDAVQFALQEADQ